MSADFVPAPPKGITVTADKNSPNQLDVGWEAVPTPNNGSPVENYVVGIEGPGLSTSKTVSSTSTSFSGAQSAAQYTVTVSARNGADRDGTVVQWNSANATGTAIGMPAAPTLSANGSRQDRQTAVTLNASESDWGGGGTTMKIAKYAAGTPIPSDCSTSGAEYVWTASSASDVISSQYRYVALADNGLFCSASRPASVEGYKTPDQPSGSATVPTDGLAQQDYGITVTGSGTGAYLYYSLNGGTPVRFSGTADVGAGSGFGIATQVTITSCATAGDYCSSSPTYTATAFTTHATITSAIAGQPPVININNGNADYKASDYGIQYCSRGFLGALTCTGEKPDNGGAYTSADPVPADAVEMRVSATVNSKTDPGYTRADVTPAPGS